ncbi:hypothetical protein [Vibrio agarivorans]|uniref:Uncharacterized protein n=1 Tax=Vibrio agarivorans TaxID=153622 RepID=A0ABT7Y7I3_9VIBR|nr:hypothetical protein [Vibrio agarivorans]MDN2484019.1 hypothetical protein [Vibrio agarivorans]
MTEVEQKEAFERGASAAKTALDGATRPLMIQDECGLNETQNAESMGWNSICASDENQALWKKEHERIAQNRKYFEDGCLCLQEGLIEKKGSDISNISAVIYYESACKCSRNYKQQ